MYGQEFFVINSHTVRFFFIRVKILVFFLLVCLVIFCFYFYIQKKSYPQAVDKPVENFD